MNQRLLYRSLFATAGSWPRQAALLVATVGLVPAAFGQAVTFAPVTSFSTGASTLPLRTAVADVNGDGKLDALVTNSTANTLGVLLGDGTGKFTLQANAPSTGAGGGPRAVAVADVNGDGKLDALVANYQSTTLGVLLGNGSGGFTLQAAMPRLGVSNPTSLVVADVNGDGKIDVLATDSNGGALSVLLGNGSGGFTYQSSSPATGGDIPYDVAVADVNGDGKVDALVVNNFDGTLGVLLGTGTGSFTLQGNTATGGANSSPYSVAIADVNGDGKPDALVANRGTSTLGVLLGNGSGGFTLQASSPSTGTGSRPTSVAVADFNGDGKLDALVTNTDAGTLAVLLGNGSGSFTLQTAGFNTGAISNTFGLTVADVNGDRKPDALVANTSSNTLSVLLNRTVMLATRAALPGTSASLYPNPAHAAATLAVAGLPAQAARVRALLLDATGRAMGQPVLVLAGTGPGPNDRTHGGLSSRTICATPHGPRRAGWVARGVTHAASQRVVSSLHAPYKKARTMMVRAFL
jgi:uncharacterized protein (DUF2141 family)